MQAIEERDGKILWRIFGLLREVNGILKTEQRIEGQRCSPEDAK
jgi:hypothetical protein